MIYFITQGKDYIRIGHVDIYSHALLLKYQESNPVEIGLYAVIEGDAAAARGIQDLFLSNSLRGEWYNFDSKIKNYLHKTMGRGNALLSDKYLQEDKVTNGQNSI